MKENKLGVVEDDGSFRGLCTCGFTTSGWPSHDVAEKRIRQHGQEHQTGVPMDSPSVFRGKNNLVSMGKLAVLPEGVTEVSLED
jgi:hypothetical protein